MAKRVQFKLKETLNTVSGPAGLTGVIIGISTKGEVNERRLYTNINDWITENGEPVTANFKTYWAVEQYLQESSSLYFTRVEDSDKLTACVAVTGENISEFGTIDPASDVADYPLSYDDDCVGIANTELSVFAEGPGTYYNNFAVAWINYADFEILRTIKQKISDYNWKTQATTADIETYYESLSDGIKDDIFDMTDYDDPINEGVINAYFIFDVGPQSSDEIAFYVIDTVSLSVKEGWIVSRDSDDEYDDGTSMFLNTVVNDKSNYIKAFLSTSEANASGSNIVEYSVGNLSGNNSSYEVSLANAEAGSSSLATVQDEIITQLNKLYSSRDDVKFDLLIDQGLPTVVKNAYGTLVENREDSKTILSVLMSEIVNVNTGKVLDEVARREAEYSEDTLSVNSKYAKLIGNAAYIYDSYNDKFRWVPCGPHAAAAEARTESRAERWFPTAGEEHGRLDNIEKLAYNPNEEQREILRDARVNPVSDRGAGPCIYGEVTRYITTGPYRDDHIISLVVYIRNTMVDASYSFLWRLNDDFTRTRYTNSFTPFLRSCVNRRGLHSFTLQCDANNQDSSSPNKLICDLTIVPIDAIHDILINLTTDRQTGEVAVTV